jgi:starvation-inducible DNA-binding protein
VRSSRSSTSARGVAELHVGPSKSVAFKSNGGSSNLEDDAVEAGRFSGPRTRSRSRGNSGDVLMANNDVQSRRASALAVPGRFEETARKEIAGALNALLADVFALYLKTKNFHWHMSGPEFRSYHLMLDDQGSQLLAATDPIAERVRKIGGSTIRSIGHVARLQRVLDNDANYVTPLDMLAELRGDNQELVGRMLEVHELCDGHRDVASASLLENWIDEAEQRLWFLFELGRRGETPGA